MISIPEDPGLFLHLIHPFIRWRALLNLSPVLSFHGKQMGKKWEQSQILFSWAPKSLQMVSTTMKLTDAGSLEEKLWPTRTAY